MRTRLFTWTALTIGLTVASRADAQRDRRTSLDTTFSFDKSGTVVVGGGSASVVVTSWDQSTIRVRGRAEDGYLQFEASSRRVTIAPSRSGDDAIIQVTVPRGVRIEAHSRDGDISIKGTRGDVDATTGSGDVQVVEAGAVTAASLSGSVYVTQATGAVDVTSSNGDLILRQCSGTVDANSVSGDVNIDRSTSKSVKASTTSGDVAFGGTLIAQGTYSLTSHSGDIEIALEKDASAQISFTTWSGSVDSEFPITIKPASGSSPDITKHFTFTLGGGAAKLTAETFSGDIVLRSKGG
jgi:DUF4097 and DUF4098 domain-containing protein YvlB